MNVKEAVQAAKLYVRDLFSEEGVANPRLEEVEYDGDTGVWNITLGFLRPRPASVNGVASALLTLEQPDMKVVRINDKNEQVLSIKNREPYG